MLDFIFLEAEKTINCNLDSSVECLHQKISILKWFNAI